MNIDVITLGERLRVARESAGLTQVEVAERMGVARTTVVAIEKGTRRVKPEELIKLGDLYGETLNRLVRPTSIVPDLSLQFRRSPKSTSDSAVEVTRLLQRLAASYTEIEQLVGVRVLDVKYPPEYQIRRGKLDEQAEDLAQSIRHHIGVGPRSPITDLESVLECEIGMRIFSRSIRSDIAGAFAYHASVGACVLLNLEQPLARRRWTLAHELGHFVTQRQTVDIVSVAEHGEVFADLFAGSFLMPAAEMRRRHQDGTIENGAFTLRHLVYLADAFGVSLEAACRRLERLGLLAAGTFEMLKQKGLNRELIKSARTPQSDTAPKSPSRFGLLAAEAYERGLLSEGQVSEMLGLDRLEVRALLDQLSDLDLRLSNESSQ